MFAEMLTVTLPRTAQAALFAFANATLERN
jgi:hypothetical protein